MKSSVTMSQCQGLRPVPLVEMMAVSGTRGWAEGSCAQPSTQIEGQPSCLVGEEGLGIV